MQELLPRMLPNLHTRHRLSQHLPLLPHRQNMLTTPSLTFDQTLDTRADSSETNQTPNPRPCAENLTTMSERRQTEWEFLPPEALHAVFRCLDIQEVCTCSLVCKNWKRVSEGPEIWLDFLREIVGDGAPAPVVVDAKRRVIKATSAQLYTWGAKALELPATSMRNRLTSPTPVSASFLAANSEILQNPGCRDAGSEGSLGSLAVRHVAAGEDFSVFVTWSGKVVDTRAWGKHGVSSRLQGDQGVDSTSVLLSTMFPCLWTPPGQRITRVAVGGNSRESQGGGGGHVLALTCSGDVWSWGNNWSGQLGLGVVTEFLHQPEVALHLGCQEPIVGVSCGKSHSVAWTEDGVLFACGDNSQGACGLGFEQDMVPVFLRVEVPAPKVVHAACGVANTIVCSEEGGVWVTGDNSSGQCGKRAVQADKCFDFVFVGPDASWRGTGSRKENPGWLPQKVVRVAASSATMAALTSKGELYTWGKGSQGELGTGGASKVQEVPMRLPWASRIKTVSGSSGGRFAAAIDCHGRLFTWGEGKFGQLGHGDTNKRTTGRAVKSLYSMEVVDVACGSDFMMAVTGWKPSLRGKGKMNKEGKHAAVGLATSPSMGAMADDELASSVESGFRYIECIDALSTSPLAASPFLSQTYGRRSRRSRGSHCHLPLSVELGAHCIEGDSSDFEMSTSPGSPGPQRSCRSAKSNRAIGYSADNDTLEGTSGAIPIAGSRRRSQRSRRNDELDRQDPESSPEGGVVQVKLKKNKKYETMLRRMVKAFANDPHQREMYFPPDLTSHERFKVHQAAEDFGLYHESVGEEPTRQLRLWKPQPRKNRRNRRPKQEAQHSVAHEEAQPDDTDLPVFGPEMELET